MELEEPTYECIRCGQPVFPQDAKFQVRYEPRPNVPAPWTVYHAKCLRNISKQHLMEDLEYLQSIDLLE